MAALSVATRAPLPAPAGSQWSASAGDQLVLLSQQMQLRLGQRGSNCALIQLPNQFRPASKLPVAGSLAQFCSCRRHCRGLRRPTDLQTVETLQGGFGSALARRTKAANSAAAMPGQSSAATKRGLLHTVTSAATRCGIARSQFQRQLSAQGPANIDSLWRAHLQYRRAGHLPGPLPHR